MALIEPIFSYQHLVQMADDGKRYEIVGGELVASPSPTFRHQEAAKRLLAFLLRAEDAGYGTGFMAPSTWSSTRTTSPNPISFSSSGSG